MNFSEIKKILLRLFRQYVKKYFKKLILALLLSLLVAASTGAIAWLLDPAVKKIFVDQDKTMMLLIPIAIAFSFSLKGASLYAARTILINLSNDVVKTMQTQLASCILKSDISTIESKQSGKYLANFFYDVGILTPPDENTLSNDGAPEKQNNVLNENFKICPACNAKTLKVENGCDVCVQCGYSKCDK